MLILESYATEDHLCCFTEITKLTMVSQNITDYKLIKLIAKGGYSKVFVVEYENKIYAMKMTKKEKCRITKFGNTEKNILEKVKHPFIIEMSGFLTTSQYYCYILEYAQGGNILYHFENTERQTEENIKFYAAEAILAIAFLHSQGVVHRDIKLPNILIANDGHIRLADFGTSAELNLEERTKSFSGTPMYMAPEIARGDYYSYEVDWWSLGICLYFMLYNDAPYKEYPNNSFNEDISAFLQRTKIPFPATISETAVSLLKGLLKKNPSDRLGKAGVHEIQSHAFFASMDWERLLKKEIEPPFIPQIESPTDFQYFNLHDALEQSRPSKTASI